MAAASMAQQAQLLIRILFALAVINFSCNTVSSETPTPFLNGTSGAFEMKNGILYHNGNLYTGRVYNLYDGSSDTAEILEFKEGKEDGEWTRFYPGHHLKERRQFDNGKKVGDLNAWWPDGKKQLEFHLENDEYEGSCRQWNAEGLLISDMNYSKGHEEGEQKLWWDNGKVRANYVITNNRRYGLLGTKNCKNVSDSIL